MLLGARLSELRPRMKNRRFGLHQREEPRRLRGAAFLLRTPRPTGRLFEFHLHARSARWKGPLAGGSVAAARQSAGRLEISVRPSPRPRFVSLTTTTSPTCGPHPRVIA